MTSVTDSTKRVFLWSTPRSLSTAFMRAISNVDDFIVWCEPYLHLTKAGYPRPANMTMRPNLTIYDRSAVPDQFFSMYDKRHTFSWLKEQLEGNFPGKRLVFVKDIVEGIHGRYTDLPKGYRHTFLIRHPLKVFASLKKMYEDFYEGEIHLDKLPETIMPPGYHFQDMYDFFTHVEEFHEPRPILIDADDLQADPVAMMKAYCREIGIPFDERIVNWNGEASYKNWIAPIECFGLYNTLKKCIKGSTGFNKPTELPSRSNLSDDVLKLADASMEFYEKLHAQRLVVE